MVPHLSGEMKMSLRAIIWTILALVIIVAFGGVRKLKRHSDKLMKVQEKLRKWKIGARMRGD